MNTFLFLVLSVISFGQAEDGSHSFILRGAHTVGNGGDVIDCSGKPGGKVVLLDYFEAEEFRNIVRDLGANTLSDDDKFEIAMRRLQKVSPMRADLYREWYDDFLGETHFTQHPLKDVEDSEHIAVPVGCTIEQIAIQPQNVPHISRYIINKPLWNKLDGDSRVGLILHELIYREALNFGAKNSIRVRYFNSVVTSDEINNYLDLDSFSEFMELIEIDAIEYLGVWVSARYYNKKDVKEVNGWNIQGILSPSIHKKTPHPFRNDCEFYSWIKNGGKEYCLQTMDYGPISHDYDFNIDLKVLHSIRGFDHFEFPMPNQSPVNIVSHIDFFPSGKVYSIFIWDTDVEIVVPGQTPFSNARDIYFYETGEIHEVQVREKGGVFNQNGQQVRVPPYHTVTFAKDGNYLKSRPTHNP